MRNVGNVDTRKIKTASRRMTKARRTDKVSNPRASHSKAFLRFIPTVYGAPGQAFFPICIISLYFLF